METPSDRGTDESAHALFSIYFDRMRDKAAHELGYAGRLDPSALPARYRLVPLDAAVNALNRGTPPPDVLRFAIWTMFRSLALPAAPTDVVARHIVLLTQKYNVAVARNAEVAQAAGLRARALAGNIVGVFHDLLYSPVHLEGTRSRAAVAFEQLWEGKSLGRYEGVRASYAPDEPRR